VVTIGVIGLWRGKVGVWGERCCVGGRMGDLGKGRWFDACLLCSSLAWLGGG
jgi:hypothetical protein